MPRLIFEKKAAEVAAGESCVKAGEELGIPFSCEEGNCGACLVKVERGMENLIPYTEPEKQFGLDSDERLLCQARIVSGEVEVSL